MSEGDNICVRCETEVPDHQQFRCDYCDEVLCQCCYFDGYDENLSNQLEEYAESEESFCGACQKERLDLFKLEESKNPPKLKTCDICEKQAKESKMYWLGGPKPNRCDQCTSAK